MMGLMTILYGHVVVADDVVTTVANRIIVEGVNGKICYFDS